jgi:hypothetical protein
MVFFPVSVENNINKMQHKCNIFAFETRTYCLPFILLNPM